MTQSVKQLSRFVFQCLLLFMNSKRKSRSFLISTCWKEMLKLQLLSRALPNLIGFPQCRRNYAPLYLSSHLPNTDWDKTEHPGVRRSLTITPCLDLSNLLSSAIFQPWSISGFAISGSSPHRGSQMRTALATTVAEK